MSACVWCKRNEQIDAYLGVCSLQCSRAYEAYERGKVDERVNALSGTDAYLKQAITEATNEAYQRGRDEERADVLVWLSMRTDNESGYATDAIEKGEHEVKR